MDGKMRELLIRTEEEKIASKNKNGLEYLHSILVQNKPQYEALIGKDGKSGILNEVIAKSKTHGLITEGDIHNLIEAAK